MHFNVGKLEQLPYETLSSPYLNLLVRALEV